MRYERTDYERLTDNALLLSLWAKTQERAGGTAAGDRLKLMKLAFLAAYPLFWDRTKGLNLHFYRWKWGPMANQVYDTWTDLVSMGLLLEEEEFVVSEEGIRFANDFSGEVLHLSENARILHVFEQVVRDYAELDRPQILERVYDLHCYTIDSPGRKHQVRAIAQGKDFTRLLEEHEAEDRLYVPPGWMLTLELTFHPDALRNLQRGVEDCHAGRVEPWESSPANV
jgi:hypothetical protein